MAPDDKRPEQAPFLPGGRALERRRQFLEQRGLPGADLSPGETGDDPRTDDDRESPDDNEATRERPPAEPGP